MLPWPVASIGECPNMHVLNSSNFENRMLSDIVEMENEIQLHLQLKALRYRLYAGYKSACAVRCAARVSVCRVPLPEHIDRCTVSEWARPGLHLCDIQAAFLFLAIMRPPAGALSEQRRDMIAQAIRVVTAV
jgi:hypothetical protein